MFGSKAEAYENGVSFKAPGQHYNRLEGLTGTKTLTHYVSKAESLPEWSIIQVIPSDLGS